MSRENLSNLLDAMLEDSAIDLAAEQVRAAEAKAEEDRTQKARALRERARTEREAARLHDIDELTGLTEEDLRAVLGKAAPDDLLVVLATASDVLMRRLLGSLSEDSVRWLRQNLEHMDRITDAERDGARGKVLKSANQLLEAGDIAFPEPESIGAPEAPRGPEKELRDLLTELVQIGEQTGTEALAELAESAGEPLLRGGLSLVVDGKKGDDLRRELAKIRADLEKRYGQRLLWMEEALVAIGDGESAEEFRKRLFE